jgi:hypothetical protein
MFLFKAKLEKAGIPDTRTDYLSAALEDLHSAIAMCDTVNRSWFAAMYPDAVRAAIDFAKVEGLNQDLWGECREGDIKNGTITTAQICTTMIGDVSYRITQNLTPYIEAES